MIATRTLRRYVPVGYQMAGKPPVKIPIARLEITKKGERCDWVTPDHVYASLGWAVPG